MKNIIIRFIIISIISSILYSCEDVATNVKIPAAEKKIVVQCFISPQDDTVKVMLSWSKPVLGTSFSSKPEFIKNAIVEISDDNNKAILVWDSINNLFTLGVNLFKIEAGKKYFLNVKTPDGKEVSANCTTPLSPNQTLELHKIDSSKNNWNETVYNCTYKYKDHESSQFNYYRILNELVYEFGNESDYIAGEFKSNNEINNDNIFKSTLYKYFYNSGSVLIKAYIISSDYNYYQYHKTLQNAQYNYGIFTEPSLVFSNIKGGLGCFGAYYSYSIETKIK